MKAAGIVLAGGLARRMGGGDKCTRLLAGRTILDHVLDRLTPQVGVLAINANGDPARFSRWRLPVIVDTVPGNAGPLAGVLAGMRWAAAAGQADIVTVPADTPFIPGNLVERFYKARNEAAADIAIAASGGRPHPVVGLWPAALAKELEVAIQVKEIRRVAVFLEDRRVARAEFSVGDRDPFFNINDPAQMREAERLLRVAPEPE